MTLEGSGASRLLQLFGGDKTHPTTITTAVIRTPLPDISIRIDGEPIDTPSQGIIVAEHLTEHTRTVSISGGTVSGNVSEGGTLNSLTVGNATMTIKTNLKAGDRVIVAIANDGQLVYILDKAVV